MRQYFSLYRAVSQREGERGKRIDESNNNPQMSKQSPAAPTASAVGPSYYNPNCRTPRHWKLTQHREQAKVGRTHASMSVGGHAPAPFNFEMALPPHTHTHIHTHHHHHYPSRGWSGSAMVLGKLPVPGRPTILITVGGAYCTCSRCGWGLFGHFYSHLSFLFSFSLSLGDGPI